MSFYTVKATGSAAVHVYHTGKATESAAVHTFQTVKAIGSTTVGWMISFPGNTPQVTAIGSFKSQLV